MTKAPESRPDRTGSPDAAAPLPVQEALERLSLLDINGASESFDRWLASLGPDLRQSPAASHLLLDALVRAGRIAGELSPGGGFDEESRVLLAQRLRTSGSHQECVRLFREALREIVSSMARPPRGPAPRGSAPSSSL
jgi:hypothetical protein